MLLSDMESFINKFIDQNIKGVDAYQHNGSTWLIFTNDKRWVIELTKDKTLWYNYNFFKSIFEFFSMDVVENQHYITKWVEDTVINGVKDTKPNERLWQAYVEDTIQNGVKRTVPESIDDSFAIEDTIQNGVKHTDSLGWKCGFYIEDTIQNGVKHTISKDQPLTTFVEDTIQNGVKETKISPTHTEYGDWLDGDERLDEIIKNGVKETNSTNFPNGNCGYIKEILRKGIKTVQPLPAQDGNRDWGNYYHGKEDRTKPFNEYLNEAIEFGVIAKTP